MGRVRRDFVGIEAKSPCRCSPSSAHVRAGQGSMARYASLGSDSFKAADTETRPEADTFHSNRSVLQ